MRPATQHRPPAGCEIAALTVCCGASALFISHCSSKGAHPACTATACQALQHSAARGRAASRRALGVHRMLQRHLQNPAGVGSAIGAVTTNPSTGFQVDILHIIASHLFDFNSIYSFKAAYFIHYNIHHIYLHSNL